MAIERALISVSDKTGIVEFAKFLQEKNVEIISTGGTANVLRGNGIDTIDISDITNFPEMLDGRVKTLHPAIHAGLLYVRGDDNHEKTVEEHKIGKIDLVIVNLYPFEMAVKNDLSKEEIIENIDIGGPSMLRSASKNFKSVTVVTEIEDYELIKEQIEKNSDTTLETRTMLANKVFNKTANYDFMIAKFFSENFEYNNEIQKYSSSKNLRYGENPHQKAFFSINNKKIPSVINGKKLQGKEFGYCNILDADAALNIVLDFPETPMATIIKHTNPCGSAIGKNIEEAFSKSLEADKISAFGGIVALNREVSGELAKQISEIFFEIIIAPKFSEEARKILKKKKNLRLVEIENMYNEVANFEIKSINGGLLVQDKDNKEIKKEDLDIKTGKIEKNEINDILFAWKICKHVKSNAIVLVKDGATVGVGAGQMSRVESTKIALSKAGNNANGAIAASDAFFPFSDGVETLIKGGIKTIIQPGGSKIGDKEVLEVAKKHEITMIFTGARSFKH